MIFFRFAKNSNLEKFVGSVTKQIGFLVLVVIRFKNFFTPKKHKLFNFIFVITQLRLIQPYRI